MKNLNKLKIHYWNLDLKAVNQTYQEPTFKAQPLRLGLGQLTDFKTPKYYGSVLLLRFCKWCNILSINTTPSFKNLEKNNQIACTSVHIKNILQPSCLTCPNLFFWPNKTRFNSTVKCEPKTPKSFQNFKTCWCLRFDSFVIIKNVYSSMFIFSGKDFVFSPLPSSCYQL